MLAVALASSALTVGADGGQCADAGPFPCLGAACPSPAVDCDFLARACSFDAFEPLLELRRPNQQGGGGGSASYAGTDLTIGDLCPESCGLCDERCERLAPSTPPAPPVPRSDLSAGERAAWLAAGRERPNDHRCIVDHWIDAVRHQPNPNPNPNPHRNPNPNPHTNPKPKPDPNPNPNPHPNPHANPHPHPNQVRHQHRADVDVDEQRAGAAA